jgi:hypothetical protein
MTPTRSFSTRVWVTIALGGLIAVACGTGDGTPGPSAAGAVPPSSPAAATASMAATPSVAASATPTASAAIIRVPTAVVEGAPYQPSIDPATFTTTIDAPFLPLTPGTTLRYEGGSEQIEVTTTGATRMVMGVATLVVHDRVREDGKITEDTEDWYAQDAAGNVWYFGEDTAECENGAITNRDGAWEAGVDGAQPGVAMLADARVGDHYRQEYLPGKAEDQARVLRLGDSVTVPAGSFSDVLVTEDFTPLEPDLLEDKLYAPGVGVVEEREVKGGSGVVKLTEIIQGAPASGPAPAFDPCHE